MPVRSFNSQSIYYGCQRCVLLKWYGSLIGFVFRSCWSVSQGTEVFRFGARYRDVGRISFIDETVCFFIVHFYKMYDVSVLLVDLVRGTYGHCYFSLSGSEDSFRRDLPYNRTNSR